MLTIFLCNTIHRHLWYHINIVVSSHFVDNISSFFERFKLKFWPYLTNCTFKLLALGVIWCLKSTNIAILVWWQGWYLPCEGMVQSCRGQHYHEGNSWNHTVHHSGSSTSSFGQCCLSHRLERIHEKIVKVTTTLIPKKYGCCVKCKSKQNAMVCTSFSTYIQLNTVQRQGI